MRTFANSDPDQIPHNATLLFGISSGYALFAKTKSIFRKRNSTVLEIITYGPSIYTMEHPVSNFMENKIPLVKI